MNIDKYGRAVLSSDEAFEVLYSGKSKNLIDTHIDNALDISKFNKFVKENGDDIPMLQEYKDLDISIGQFDINLQNNWFMPKEYKDFEIVGFLLDQTQNEEQYQRVVTELDLFIQHNMIDLLKYLKYLVDTMRSNNIVWGVGRGSSVASYCLYLLGVHKIDSIKYELDIKEFLK